MLRKLHYLIQKWGDKFWTVALILLALVGANLMTSFVLGFLSAFNKNIKIVGPDKFRFEPSVTIAYILLWYFITLFYQPAIKIQYFLFIVTLILSFTVSFMQGAFYLVVLYFLLRRLQLI